VTTKIFANLPVKDLNKTIEFFTKLGFKFNPQFTDENATCMIVGEDIFVMLLIENFLKLSLKSRYGVFYGITDKLRRDISNSALRY
jgi:uncharacterized protein